MILLSHNLVPDTLWAKISTDIGKMIGGEPANIQTDPTKWWPKLQNPSEPEAKKSLKGTDKSLTSKRLLISSTSLCNTCPASKGTKQEKILICSRPQGHQQNHYPLLQSSPAPKPSHHQFQRKPLAALWQTSALLQMPLDQQVNTFIPSPWDDDKIPGQFSKTLGVLPKPPPIFHKFSIKTKKI